MKKRAWLWLLCFCLLFTYGAGVACGNTEKEPIDEENPPMEETVYTPQNIREKPSAKDDILIGSYVSLAEVKAGLSNREQIERLADGGLNFFPLASCITSKGMINDGERLRRDLSSVDWWKRIDDVMKDNNMLYYFSTKTGLSNDGGEAARGAGETASADAVKAAKEVVPQLDNCIGYMLKDEPSYTEFDSLASYAKQYAKVKDGLYAHVNHFPIVVGYSGDYYSFLKGWITRAGAQNIEYLGHDAYPFMAGGNAYTFLSLMEDMRKLAVENNLKLACFPQSCAWNGTRMPTHDEIVWSMNAYLAHGFSMFTYFNYSMYPHEGCYDAIFDLQGNMLHRELYDSLTQYHLKLRAMGANCNFSSLRSRAVYYTGNTIHAGTKRLPAGWYVDNGELNKKTDLILSYLSDDGQENEYIMVVNNSYSKEVQNQKFTIGKRGEDYAKWELYNMENGTFSQINEEGAFTLSLGKSEAALIKISK